MNAKNSSVDDCGVFINPDPDYDGDNNNNNNDCVAVSISVPDKEFMEKVVSLKGQYWAKTGSPCNELNRVAK